MVYVNGSEGSWATNAGTSHPSGVAAHSSPNLIYFNSWTAHTGHDTRLYRTSGIDLSGFSDISISFWMYHDTGFSTANDRIQMQVSTNGGTVWNNVGSPISRYNAAAQWTQHTVDLNAYTGPGYTDVRVALLGISAWGNDIHIDDIRIHLPCTAATGGLVAGTVYDQNTGLHIANVPVKSAASSAVSGSTGIYVLFAPAGAQDVTAIGPRGYDNVTESVSVAAAATTGQNFTLPAGLLAATPKSLTFDVSADTPTASQGFTLSNSGNRAANYKTFTIPGIFPGYAPTGPFAVSTPHTAPPHLNDNDASALSIDIIPRSITPMAAGNVTASWDTGLVSAWGIGFNTVDTDLWLGNIGAGGGDDLDYRFTTAGVNTGDTIATATWMSAFAADMTYNPFTNKLWQVNVGGDDCIYELDPVLLTVTGNKICPAFGTSERGLAFDPVSSTYYSGSWNDSIINHFGPDGTILDSKNTGLSISGLAFNPETRHLFVMTNAKTTSDPTLYDVYVLDTNDDYTSLGGFNLIMDNGTKAFADNAQAGLEIDCSGNLWAVNQATQKVYIADSGETGVCDWLVVRWLTVTPATGTAAASGSAASAASVDASGQPAGTYRAFVRVANDTPYGDIIVPVTMNVSATTTTTVPPCADKDGDGYLIGNNCTPLDCNDNDTFYNELCPDCEVKLIPRARGWLLGEKEKTRVLLVIGKGRTEFDDSTDVRWENDGISVVSKLVFMKRFMLMRVRIDGAALDKGSYRALIGTCSATLSLVK
jgi:hypothetical protein